MKRLLLLSALLGSALVGCDSGDGEERMEMPPAPRTSPSRPATTAAAAPANVVDQVLQDTSRAAFTRESRDPFTPYRKPYEETAAGGSGPERDCDLKTHPLGNVELSELRLIGLVTGTPIPRAMVVSRGEPKAYLLQEGALAGGECGHKLIQIRDNEIVWQQQSVMIEDRTETAMVMSSALNSEDIIVED